jgi:hypothetical protein
LKTLLYQLTQRGFTSELNNLLLALLYCETNRIEFRLSSRYWGAAHNKGWEDYFEPFCQEQNNRLTRIGTIKRLPKAIARRQRIYKILRPRTLFTHDIWPLIQTPEFLKQHFSLPAFQIDGNIFHAKQKLLEHISPPSPTIHQAIQSITHAISPPYVALHIRRGDKIVSEATRIEIDDYVAAIQRVAPKSKRVFIATDDYSVVEEFRQRFPVYQVFTLCSQKQQGHQQSTFNKACPDQKKSDTLNLLADIECISKADHFIGTFSSNIGRFIALKVGLDQCTSLDVSWHPL